MAILYVQLALGSVKDRELSFADRQGHCYKIARLCRSLSEYFLESASGFKQLMKMGSFIGKGLEMGGVALSPPVANLLTGCRTAKNLLVATESYTKLKHVFRPLHEYSVWNEDEDSSWAGQALGKSADIANWTMSNCDTYNWLAKMGFVATRTATNKIFSFASVVYTVQSLRVEGAKWWTGRVINPLNGQVTNFTDVQKIKSIFICTVTCAYAAMTAIAVAQMVGYVVANAVFWNFALSGVAALGTIGGHFWEELMIKF